MTQCQRYGAVQMLNIDAIRLSKKKKDLGMGLAILWARAAGLKNEWPDPPVFFITLLYVHMQSFYCCLRQPKTDVGECF
jgi:hypothetical protein